MAAAGAIAKQLLKQAAGTEVLAWVKRIHTIEASSIDPQEVQLRMEANIVRCPEPETAERMIERIEAIGREGDSCGGVTNAWCAIQRLASACRLDNLKPTSPAVMSLPAPRDSKSGPVSMARCRKAVSTTMPSAKRRWSSEDRHQ